MKKIAFLFLIYDVINQEEMWYNFFKNIDKNKYSIYIHYKFNKEMKYFNEYKLEKCIPTEYCKTSIVEAQNLLIETALLDVDNYKFITLSQACIPFKSFNYIYNLLIENNLAYFKVKKYLWLFAVKYFCGTPPSSDEAYQILSSEQFAKDLFEIEPLKCVVLKKS